MFTSQLSMKSRQIAKTSSICFFAADKYDVEHLRKACLVFIKENINEDNAEEVLRFAMMIRHVKIIKEAALKIRE